MRPRRRWIHSVQTERVNLSMSHAIAKTPFCLAVAALFCGTALLTIDAGITAMALPFIKDGSGQPRPEAVLLVVAYNLVLAMTLLPFASLGERRGMKKVYVGGVLLYLVGAGLCFVVDQISWLIVVRVLQALGAAASLSVAVGLLRNLYPLERLGMGMGINTIASVTGAALAPIVGGWVISLLAWKWVFAAGVPLAVISLALVRFLPEAPRTQRQFDTMGGLLCAATFGLLIVGLESLNHGVPRILSFAPIFAGTVTALVFVKHQRGVDHPVLPVDLLALPTLSLSIGAAFGAVLSSWFLMLSMPFLLDAYGFSALEIGSLLLPYVIATAICSPVSGFLSDRLSPVLLSTMGLSVALLGLISFGWLDSTVTHAQILWRMAMCGAGFGLFFSPNARLIIGSAPRSRSASASSLISTTRVFGQALGSTIFGGFLAMNVGITDAIATFAVVTVLLALLLGLARWWVPASTRDPR